MRPTDAHRALAACALLAAVLITPSAALAAHGHASRHDPRGVGSRNETSDNWSGYAASGFGPYTSVSASWVEPTANCSKTANGNAAFWIGIDGDIRTSKTVEQTGTEANCSAGKASYGAWYELYPKYPVNYPQTVKAGDDFTGSVTSLPGGKFAMTLTDSTEHWSITETKKFKKGKLLSAEVIAEAPSSGNTPLPLTDFGTVQFTGVTFNESLLQSSLSGLEPITIENSKGVVEAEPSSVSGGAFSVTWKNV